MMGQSVSESTPNPASRLPWLTRPWPLSRALWIVFFVALAVRLLMLGGITLDIHNDGIDYLNGAMGIYHHLNFGGISCFRTPGYPILIAIAYWIFGQGAVGILILQHGLGMLTALCITGIAGFYLKPKWAMLPGLFVALDPQVFGVASMLETEWAAILFFAVASLLVLRVTRGPRPMTAAILAGLTIGFACLVRPTFQVTLPFLLIAVISGAVGVPKLAWKRRAKLGAAFTLATTLMLAPWIIRNQFRGIAGLSNGFGPALWTSLCQQDLLDRDYPLPPDEAERYAAVKPFHGASDAMWGYMKPLRTDQAYIIYRTKLTKDWALESIRKNFPAYAARTPWSFVWQMNLYPKSGFIAGSQLNWFFWMLSTDIDDHQRVNTNFFFDGVVVDAFPLTQSGRDGPMRALFVAWNRYAPGGLPQIPLTILALTTGILALRKKDWALAWLLLASAAFVGVHVFMIFHQSRYSLPSTVMWYSVALIPFAAMFPKMRSDGWPWPTRPRQVRNNTPPEVVVVIEPKPKRREFVA